MDFQVNWRGEGFSSELIIIEMKIPIVTEQ